MTLDREPPAARGTGKHRLRTRLFIVLASLLALAPVVHAAIGLGTRIAAPEVLIPPPEATHAWRQDRAGVTRVYLQGSAEAIGAETSRLLRDRMLAEEGDLWGQYEEHVPWWLARVGIEDYSRLRYRHVDRGVPDARRREVAAEALAVRPDPFDDRMPTYQRMMFLYALYDIALPLEHSPLIGCTSFAFDGSATSDGHVLFARAFDFEAGERLDREKVVYLVREDGRIPFASVAWPGFVGVVTGMNAEGVVMVVHGGRARTPVVEGIPVAFSLREALGRAHDTAEAVRILQSQSIMVSHIVFVADREGNFAVVERAPGEPAFVRDAKSHGTMAVTNHFEGPLAADPKNARVRESTSTLARRARIDQLLAGVTPHSVTPAMALEMLRDHHCVGDDACPLGDRRAIDAFIATHGIVADATDRVLWVSAGPHLRGRFVKLDL
ncbi:MAG TPA: C45 family peptidase, partial [Polyangiaceae bacterium]|nr:C45 family peptidase [Polyangiaceae bacterium]